MNGVPMTKSGSHPRMSGITETPNTDLETTSTTGARSIASRVGRLPGWSLVPKGSLAGGAMLRAPVAGGSLALAIS